MAGCSPYLFTGFFGFRFPSPASARAKCNRFGMLLVPLPLVVQLKVHNLRPWLAGWQGATGSLQFVEYVQPRDVRMALGRSACQSSPWSPRARTHTHTDTNDTKIKPKCPKCSVSCLPPPSPECWCGQHGWLTGWLGVKQYYADYPSPTDPPASKPLQFLRGVSLLAAHRK